MNLFSRVKTVFYSKTEELEHFLREKHANMHYTFVTHISTTSYVNVTKLQTQHINSSH